MFNLFASWAPVIASLVASGIALAAAYFFGFRKASKDATVADQSNAITIMKAGQHARDIAAATAAGPDRLRRDGFQRD